MNLTTILLIIGLILFILAAVGVKSERINIVAAGLAFFAASFLL